LVSSASKFKPVFRNRMLGVHEVSRQAFFRESTLKLVIVAF